MKILIFAVMALSFLSQRSNAVTVDAKRILCADSAIETMNIVNDIAYIGGGFSRVAECLHPSSAVGPATVDTQTGKLTSLYLNIPANYEYLHIIDFKGDYEGVILQGVLNDHSYLIGIKNSGRVDFTIDTTFVDVSVTGFREVFINDENILVLGSEQLGIFDRQKSTFLTPSQDIKVLNGRDVLTSGKEVIFSGYFSLENQKFNFLRYDLNTKKFSGWNLKLPAAEQREILFRSTFMEVSGNNVIIGSEPWDFSVYSFNLVTGELVWKTTIPRAKSSHSQPFTSQVYNNTLLVFGDAFSDSTKAQFFSPAILDLTSGQVLNGDSSNLSSLSQDISKKGGVVRYGKILDGVLYMTGHDLPGQTSQVVTALAFDLEKGQRNEWNPNPGVSSELTSWGSQILLGNINFLGGYDRPFLAAYDLKNQKVLSWNPKINGFHNRLSITSNTKKLFLTGEFFDIDGNDKTGFASFDLKTGIMDAGNPGGIAFSKYHVFPYSMAPTVDGVWITENDTHAGIVKIKNDGSVVQPFEVDIQQARILEVSNKLFIVTAGSEGTYDGQKYRKYFSIDLKSGHYAPWEISFSPGGSTYGGIYDIYSSNVADRLYVGCGEAYDTATGKPFRVIPQGSYGGIPLELQDKLFCFSVDAGRAKVLNIYSKNNLDLISTITLSPSFSTLQALQSRNNQIYGVSEWSIFETILSK